VRFERLSDWLSWQETLHFQKIQLGLDRVRQVGERLALGAAPFAVITVAGTNGKGSSAALLEAMLTSAGYRVGTYTSPHLLHYNERIRINGQEVSDETLCWAFDRVDQARGEIALTYFEFGTLAALVLFFETGLDAVVLEVGMGGRLDAVNYLDPDVALVTTVGIDHTAWLGSERESIGREKAGIFRAHRPAVYNDLDPPQSLMQRARELETQLYHLGADYQYAEDARSWSWQGLGQHYDSLPLPALHGAFQRKNAAGVLAALTLIRGRLPVSEQAIRQGLQRVGLPGRFQVLEGPVARILDVAHNPQAAGVLAQALHEEPCTGRTVAVFSILADKDIAGVVAALADVVEVWYVAGLDTERAAPTERIESVLRARGAAVAVHRSVTMAYTQALAQARSGDRVVVFGSFYTVAEVLTKGL
jgi:dihydrofolate synthase/folylpolyglutamate synthase